jgi:hypothetical protein
MRGLYLSVKGYRSPFLREFGRIVRCNIGLLITSNATMGKNKLDVNMCLTGGVTEVSEETPDVGAVLGVGKKRATFKSTDK